MIDPGDVLYRTATEADVEALASLRAAFTFEDHEPDVTRPDFPEAFSRVVGEGIEAGRVTVWLAESGDTILAHAFVVLVDKIPRPVAGHAFIGYLTNVYTRPEARGRGIGSQLLEHVTGWARDTDVELLVVWPSDESVQFYVRAGFESGRDPLVWESR
ncbi:MAG TPA: GNAT family N-acetyltransferase [Gaiellaceae bacterium]|nr:GNAT family N-acetyltransferase [Gaiellaceae bacterium]